MNPFRVLCPPATESVAPEQGVSPLARVISLDVIVVGYVLLTVLNVLLNQDEIPGAGEIVLWHLAGLGGYLLLRWGSTDGRLLRIVFYLSLFGLVTGLFEGMGAILPHLHAEAIETLKADRVLAALDIRFFGSDPTTWFTPILNPVTVTILQICYTSYFLLALVVTAIVLGRRKYRSFLSYAAIIIGCFFMTYVGYHLVPAYGPRVLYAYETPIPHSGLSRAIYDAIDAVDLIKLNAFPSGHTAVTLVYLAILFREARRVAWIALPFVVGLILATVALRYHYLIDVVAGAIVAAIWIPWGMRLVFWFDHGRDGRGREGAAPAA